MALLTDFEISALKAVLNGSKSKIALGGIRAGVKGAGVYLGPA